MNFTVYKSSAGSGKTFTLVKEYLRLALSNQYSLHPYKKILAITFTNKAAAEMKDRIISSLKTIATRDDKNYSQIEIDLIKELGIDAATLSSRAKNVLSEILHHYGDFAIGTIDSFTQRIVRAFAHDLKLPVNFEIETDADKLIREAVDILIGKIGDDKNLTELLVRFSGEQTDEQKNWQLEFELQHVGKQLLTEEGAKNAEKLKELKISDFIIFRNNLRKAKLEFESKIILIASKATTLLEKHAIELSEIAYGKSGIGARFYAYANGNFDSFGKPSSNIDKTISSGKWSSGTASKSTIAALDAVKTELENYWHQLEKVKDEEFPTYTFRKLVNKNIFSLAVLNELKKIILEFRDEQSILHISEFNRIISKVVFEEPVPFIYERLGEKYSNYLIDEFQDTSVMQWQNLLPLVENSLAGNNFSMLVGDGKQAIYRWRGGEVAQFAMLPKVFDTTENPLIKEREQSLIRNHNSKNLLKNWRSKKEIVEFNNLFFRAASTELSDNSKIIYENLEQEFNSENKGGYVKVEIISNEEEDLQAAYVSKTIERIQQLKKEGWQYSEICVLVRRNSDGASVASALLENGIQVLSSDSLLLSNSPVVAFLVAMLHCIDQPNNELAGAEVLEFLVSNKTIPSPLHDRLTEFQNFNNRLSDVLLLHGIHFAPVEFSRFPLYQRCERLIELFNLNSNADSYLLFFLDEILNYSSGKNSERTDFFDWWDDRRKSASVVVAEGMDAVTVMTIHKSKGLEFPVVIFPFADWEIYKSTESIWVNVNDSLLPGLSVAWVKNVKELDKTNYSTEYQIERDKVFLDTLNVLYVCMTRAVQQLYIFTKAKKETAKEILNVADLFHLSTSRMQLELQENFYEYGNSGSREINSKFTLRCIRPEHIESNDWENRIRIKSKSSLIWNQEVNQSIERGKIIHELLALIETKKDLKNACAKIIHTGISDSIEISNIEKILEEILNLKELENCFSGKGKVRKETEILLPNGKRLRPDRVIELSNATIILDYKTGSPNSKHKKQLDEYAEVLKEMGYSFIEKKIIYTETLKVESWN